MASIRTLGHLMLHPRALLSAVVRKVKGISVFKRIYHFLGNILHINRLATRVLNLENNLSDASASAESKELLTADHFRDLEDRLCLAEVREQQSKFGAFRTALCRVEDQLLELCDTCNRHHADYASVFESVRQSTDGPLCVLDLGCGSGRLLDLLKKDDRISAVGVDLDPDCVRQCLDRDLQVVHADLLSYLRHCQSSSFDVVTMLHVVEFLSRDDLIPVLKEIARVLRPAGALILELPDPEASEGRNNSAFCDPSLVTVLRPEVLSMLVRQSGLSPSETLRFAACSPDSFSASALQKLEENGLAPGSAFGPFADYAVIAFKSVGSGGKL